MRLFYNLISLSLSMTPIIVLFLLFTPALKKRYSAKWRYILWTALSIRMLLPYSFVNMTEPFKKTAANVIPDSVSAAVGQLSADTANLNNIISLKETLFVIYIGVIILYLTHEILSYAVFHRNILRWGRRTSNREIQTILEDEKKRLGIKRSVPVIISKRVCSPMLSGLIKPKLLLPSEEYTADELRIILAHELTHLKRNDISVKTIFMLVSAAHWFNPAVYLMIKQANKDMEQSCDDCVLHEADVEKKRMYCGIILKIAVNNSCYGHVFSTNIMSSKKNLESRINDIFDNSRKKRGSILLAALILLVSISGAVINVNGAEQPEAEKEYEIISEENKEKDENEFKENKPENEPIDNNIPEVPVIENIQQDSGKPENSSDIQDFTDEDNITEIVIIDLNQLENQLRGSEIDDNSDE